MKRKLAHFFGILVKKGGFFSAKKNSEIPPKAKEHLSELVAEEVGLEEGMDKSYNARELNQLKEKFYDNKLELKMYMIQKSTKTTFPQFVRLHNKLRMRYKWYYRWHLAPLANKLHWSALGTVTTVLAFLIISSALTLVPKITLASQEPKLVVTEVNAEKHPEKFFFKNPTSGKYEDASQIISDDTNGKRIRTKSATSAGYQDFLINGNTTQLFDGEKLVAEAKVIAQEKTGEWQEVQSEGLSTTLDIKKEGKGKDQKVSPKQTFSLVNSANDQRIVWEINLKDFNLSNDQNEKKDTDKHREYGQTIVDISDFKGQARWEEDAANNIVRVFFDEQGSRSSITIDPILTVTTPASQIVVDDGTRKWVFDTSVAGAPRYFYHTSIGSGATNIASTYASSPYVGPGFAYSGSVSGVSQTLVENTPTRVTIRTQGSYGTSPTAVDNTYTIYPDGHAFLQYSETTSGSTNADVVMFYNTALAQLYDHDATNHTFVLSDTSSNNYPGMAVVPYTNTEFGGAAGWATTSSQPNNYVAFYKGTAGSTYSGNMAIDFSNYRATTTTRNNERDDYRTPATLDTFTKGAVGAPAYSEGEGTYNITADGSGDSGFTFHWDSKTRYKPAFKISGATRAEGVYQVSWGGAVKTNGVDYNLSKLADGTTLVMQILSDIGADITITVDSGATGNNIWTNGSTDGKWSTDANWSSGTKPASTDDVIFDGTSTADCSIDATAVANSVTLSTGYSGTVTANANLTVNGDWSQEAGTFVGGSTTLTINGSWSRVGGTFTAGTSTVKMTNTSGTKTVTSGGQSFYNFTMDGVGGTTQFLDTFATPAAGTLTLTNGTLDTNNQAVSIGLFSSSNSNVRTLTLGSSAITMTGTVSTGVVWNFSAHSNLTFNSNTSVITFTGTQSSSNDTLDGSGQTFNNVIFQGSGQTYTRSGTFNNLTFTGSASKTDTFVFDGSGPTVNGTFTISGAAANQRLFVTSSVLGTPKTVTAAAVVLSNTDFRDITFAGTMAGTGTSIGDCGGNSGVNWASIVTAADTETWNGSTAAWSSSNWVGGAVSRVPLPQDTVILAGTNTVTADMPRLGKDISFTAGQATPLTLSTSVTSYGSVNFTNAGTFTHASQYWYFESQARTGTLTITSNGKTQYRIYMQAPSATIQLGDDLATTFLYIMNGVFDANDKNVTISNTFTCVNNVTRGVLMGNGTWIMSYVATGTIWNIASTGTLSFNAEGSTIALTQSTGSPALTFAGAGLTYNNLSITGGGTGSWAFTGANTFNNFTIGAPKTVTFPSTVTTTITGNFNAAGTAGNVITINSSTPTSAAILSKATGTVMGDYLSIQDSTATGGAVWSAGIHSTNVSNNSGWLWPTTKTWDGGGGGGDTNWTTAANWSGDAVPQTYDYVVFDGTSSNNCTINGLTTVDQFNANAGYGGTITANFDLTVNGDYILAAGTFDATSKTVVVLGSWNSTGGTFIKGTSTVNFTATITGKLITTATQAFNILNFNGAGGGWTLQDNITAASLTITAGNVIDNAKQVLVNGDIVINGTLTSTGSWIQGATGDISNPASANRIRNLTIAGAGVITTLTSDVYVGMTSGTNIGLMIGPGTLNGAGKGIAFYNGSASNTLTVNNPTMGSALGGFYYYNSANQTISALTLPNGFATLVYIRSNVATANFTADGDLNFGNNNVYIFQDNSSGSTPPAAYVDMSTYALTTTGNVYIGGSSTRNGYLKLGSGTHSITGNLTSNGTGTANKLDLGTSNLSVGGNINLTNIAVTNGAGAQLTTMTGAGASLTSAGNTIHNFSYNNGAGTLTIADTYRSDGDFTITAGTVSPGNQTMNVGGSWDMSPGTFTKGTSTVNFTATIANKTIKSGAQQFNILTFNGVAPGSWSLTDNLTASSLTVTTGLLIDNAKTVTVGNVAGGQVNGANISIANTAGLLTSTGSWVQAVTGSISNPGFYENPFRNLTIAGAGVATTLTSNVYVGNRYSATNSGLTIGSGTLYGANKGLYFYNASATFPLTINNPTMGSALGQLYLYSWVNSTLNALTVPNGFGSVVLAVQSAININITAGGNLNFGNNNVYISSNTIGSNQSTTYVDISTYSLTTTGNLYVGANATGYNGYLKLGSSVSHSVGSIASGTGTGNLLDMGSATITASGDVDFTGIAVTSVTPGSSKLVMNGLNKTITGANQTLNNLQISNNIGLANVISVSGAMTVDNGKTFSSNAALTMNAGSTTTINGTISGASPVYFMDTAGANLSTGGTLSSPVQFKTTGNNVVVPARIYGGAVSLRQGTTVSRTFTLGTAGSQTLDFQSTLNVQTGYEGDAVVTATTWNPTVNITGDVSFTKTTTGVPSISMGSGTWTVGGTVDLRNGTVTLPAAPSTATLVLNATAAGRNIYSNGNSLNNVQFNGVNGGWTLQDSFVANENLTITNGTVVCNGAITITVGGNWDSSGGTFTYDMSEVIFTAIGGDKTITTPGSASYQAYRFYKLTINSGANKVTWVAGLSIRPSGLMTITGELEIGAGKNAYIGISAKLNINADSTLSGGGIVTKGVSDISTVDHVVNNGTITVAQFIYIVSGSAATAPIIATNYGGELSVTVNDGSTCAGRLAAGTLTVGGNFSIGNTTVGQTTTLNNSVNNTPVLIGGNWNASNRGVYTKGLELVTFNATGAGRTVTTGGSAFNNVTFDGVGGGWILQDDLTVGGDLTIANGQFSTGARTVNLAGNWLHTGGTFTAGTSTVNLTGTDQAVSGTNSFNNLTKTVAADRTLTFESDLVQTVSGLLTLKSTDPTKLLALRSSASPTQWQINPTGTQDIDYVDLMDGKNNAAIITVAHAKDSGNNTNWYLTDNYVISTHADQVCGVGWTETVQAKDFLANNSTSDSATQITLTASTGTTKYYTDATYLVETTTYFLTSGVRAVFVKDMCPNNEVITLTSTDAYAKAVTSANIALGNDPPTAAITSPTNNQAVGAGTVQIAGTAADTKGGIVAKVEVQIDADAWAEATGTTDWSYNYAVSTSATHTVKARATDSLGLLGPETAAITFTVDTETPSVTITKPVLGEWITTATYEVTGTSADLGTSPISNIQVSLDGGTWHDASGTTTWTYTWTVVDGDHTLLARATDGVGNVSQTYTLPIKADTAAPSKPTDLQAFNVSNLSSAKQLVLLTWKASTDPSTSLGTGAGSGLKGYEVYKNGTKVEFSTSSNNILRASDSASRSYYIDDTNSIGTYIIKAIDNAGNISTSDEAKVEANSAEKPALKDTKATPSKIVSKDSKTTAIISWQTTTPTTSLVQYGLGGAKASQSKPDGRFNMGHTVVITDLKPQTTYHYAVSGSDVFANKVSSQDLTFTTAQAPTKEDALDVILKTLQRAFQWFTKVMAAPVLDKLGLIKSPEQVSPSLVSYDVTGTSDNPAIFITTSNKGTIEKGTDGKTFSAIAGSDTGYYLDTDITKGQTYYYRVKGVEGTVSLAPGSTSKTLPVISEVKATELSVSEDAAEAMISWQTDKLSDSTVKIGAKTYTDPGYGQSHTLVLSDLQPGQVAKYIVSSVTEEKLAATSSEHTLNTSQAPAEQTILGLILDTLKKAFTGIDDWLKAGK